MNIGYRIKYLGRRAVSDRVSNTASNTAGDTAGNTAGARMNRGCRMEYSCCVWAAAA